MRQRRARHFFFTAGPRRAGCTFQSSEHLLSYIHPAALEARRKYWTRHDAWRFAAPGTPEAQMPGWLDPSMTRVRLKEAQEEEARAAFAAEVKRLQAQQDRLCEMVAEINY